MSIKRNWIRMEVRLLSVGTRGFFARRFATRLRGFAAQFCRPQRKKNLWHQGNLLRSLFPFLLKDFRDILDK